MSLGDINHRRNVADRHDQRAQVLRNKAGCEEVALEERRKLNLQAAMHEIQANLWRKSIEQCDG